VRWLIPLLLIIPTLANADVDQRFARLRDAAEKLGSLSEFIENYAGSCGPLMTAQCEEKRKEFRRGADGRKHYMIVTEDSASVLSMGDANPISGDFVLNMTPFFSAGDSAITIRRLRRPTRVVTPCSPTFAFRRRSPTGGRCS